MWLLISQLIKSALVISNSSISEALIQNATTVGLGRRNRTGAIPNTSRPPFSNPLPFLARHFLFSFFSSFEALKTLTFGRTRHLKTKQKPETVSGTISGHPNSTFINAFGHANAKTSSLLIMFLHSCVIADPGCYRGWLGRVGMVVVGEASQGGQWIFAASLGPKDWRKGWPADS